MLIPNLLAMRRCRAVCSEAVAAKAGARAQELRNTVRFSNNDATRLTEHPESGRSLCRSHADFPRFLDTGHIDRYGIHTRPAA